MLSKRSNKNKRCYHYKYIKGDEGIFENLVDAVFILLMENSEREKICGSFAPETRSIGHVFTKLH